MYQVKKRKIYDTTQRMCVCLCVCGERKTERERAHMEKKIIYKRSFFKDYFLR